MREPEPEAGMKKEMLLIAGLMTLISSAAVADSPANDGTYRNQNEEDKETKQINEINRLPSLYKFQQKNEIVSYKIDRKVCRTDINGDSIAISSCHAALTVVLKDQSTAQLSTRSTGKADADIGQNFPTFILGEATLGAASLPLQLAAIASARMEAESNLNSEIDDVLAKNAKTAKTVPARASVTAQVGAN